MGKTVSGSHSNEITSLPTNEHYAVSLGYLPNFNPGKLTLLSSKGWKHMGNFSCSIPYGVLSSYDQIISINGVPESVYENAQDAMLAATTPGVDGRVKLELFSMLNDTTYWVSYVPINLVTKGFDESELYSDGTLNINKARANYTTGTDGIIILNNPNIPDWSKYRRISFVPRSDNPLLEQKYAQLAFENLEKSGFPFIVDDENPDLILTIAFDENMQVTSTYVPPTTQYLDNGSDTYIQKRNNGWYVNSFRKPRTSVTTGGFTHRDVNTYHFLEVCLLDAKKMQDQNQTAPPIVWQLTYRKQFERPLSLNTAAFKVLSGCRAFPGVHPFHDPVYVWNGICWDGDKAIVRDVYKYSPAEVLGLLPGDEILKIDGKNVIKLINNVSCNGKVEWKNDFSKLSFKNQSWYNMIKDAPLNPLSCYNDYAVPYVTVYYQDRYIDGNYLQIEPADIFTQGKSHIIEIKRDGKKIKLEGALYDRKYFFDATRNLPRVH